MTLRDLKCHHVPPVRIGADGILVINGLLAYVEFRVAALGPQTHLVVVFSVSEYITGRHIWNLVFSVSEYIIRRHILESSPMLVPWHVDSELFVDEKAKWKLLKLPSLSSANIVKGNSIWGRTAEVSAAFKGLKNHEMWSSSEVVFLSIYTIA